MKIEDAVSKYQTYLLVEKGLIPTSVNSYLEDIAIFNALFPHEDSKELS